MNGADRITIREALDARVRERIHAYVAAGELTACAGCGGDHNDRTADCKVCWERHYKRARRTDPVRWANEKYEQNLKRHLRRQRAKAQR